MSDPRRERRTGEGHQVVETAYSVTADGLHTLHQPATSIYFLRLDAACWRALLESPHVCELLDEYLWWRESRDFRETSSAISALVDWKALAYAPTFAELELRRSTYGEWIDDPDSKPRHRFVETPALTPEQIRKQAAESWAEVDHADD